MKIEIHNELKNIGFNPFDAVTIEFPSKTFLNTLTAGNNINTVVYLYFKTNKDFAVLFPNMYEDSFRVDYYGNVDDIKERVKDLNEKIEKGEV